MSHDEPTVEPAERRKRRGANAMPRRRRHDDDDLVDLRVRVPRRTRRRLNGFSELTGRPLGLLIREWEPVLTAGMTFSLAGRSGRGESEDAPAE